MTTDGRITAELGPSFIMGSKRCRCGNTLEMSFTYTAGGTLTFDPATHGVDTLLVSPRELGGLRLIVDHPAGEIEEMAMRPIPEDELEAWLIDYIDTNVGHRLTDAQLGDEAYMAGHFGRIVNFCMSFADAIRARATVEPEFMYSSLHVEFDLALLADEPVMASRHG